MIFMYLPKKPPSPKYSLTPFLFLYVVLLMNGELFSTSSMDRLYVTLPLDLIVFFASKYCIFLIVEKYCHHEYLIFS